MMTSLLIAALLTSLVQVSIQQQGKTSEETSDVSCSVNYMRIEMSRKAFNISKYSDITLFDKSCRASFSDSKIILDTAPHLCGSKRVETTGHIIYQNEVLMTAKPTGKLVTREHDVRVSFSCHYAKEGFVSLNSFKPQTVIDVKEEGFGNFQYNFKMYKDESFSESHSLYPIEATLSDKLYFEANSTSNDDDLVVLIDRCFATPTMDSSKDPSKYVFIENRCPLESNIEFVKAGSKRQRFKMQAFSFIKENTIVYVHCVVFMCRKSSSTDKCASGCQGNNINRLRRDVDEVNGKTSHSQYQLLDLGPVMRNRDHVSGRQSVTFPFIVLGLAVGLVVVAAVIATMYMKMRRSRAPAASELIGDNGAQEKHVLKECED